MGVRICKSSTTTGDLSQDSGDLLTSLSFLLYFICYLMPCSNYLPHVHLMASLIYFCSSSSSNINSSTIVSSTQMKNLVVFQFHLCANLLLFPLRLHQQLYRAPKSLDSAPAIAWQCSCRKPSVIISYLQNPSVTSSPYQKLWHKGIGSVMISKL